MFSVAKNELHDVDLAKGKDDIINSSINLYYQSLHLGASPLKFKNFLDQFKIIYNKIISTSGG